MAIHRRVLLVCILPFLSALPSPAQNVWPNWESAHVHPIATTPSGMRLLAVNTADQRVEMFDLSGDASLPRAMTSIAVGLEPISVRTRSDSEAWVVNQLSDSISVIDLSSGRVTYTLHTGDEPADVVFAGTPQRAFVSIAQLNQVWVYDPENLTSAPITVSLQGRQPRALAASTDGRKVYVAFFQSGNLSTLVSQTDVSNSAGPYGGVNPPPNAGNAFNPPQASGLSTPPPVAQIVRRNTSGAWLDDNNRDWSSFITWNLLDHDIAVIDVASLAVSYVDGLMTTVMALGVKPDGRVAAVGTEALNQIRFEPNVQSIFIQARIGSFDPSAIGAVEIADLNPHLDYSVRSVPTATRLQAIGDPRAILWHPSSGNAYVSGMGSNNIIVTDASGARLGRIEVGAGPTGLAFNGDGSRLYVLNKFDASLSVIDTTAQMELNRVHWFDPTPQEVKQGRPLLYDTHATSGLGQASCASCHIDARSDFLGWDLGNPQGEMKTVNQPCRQGQTCQPWHPMKGPMVTQTLQGIVGNGPMHWRGDKENLAAFAPAFVGLQGMDAQPDTTQLQQFENFISTVRYPPNPNRNTDGSLPTTVAVSNGQGDPSNGLNVFQTLPVLAGGLTCQDCHALPKGTSGEIDDPQLPLAPQGMKQAQLRGLWKKTGWNKASQTNTIGFGFNSNSEFDTLGALLVAGFNFGAPTQALQRRRDVEAFLLTFDTETPAAVGQQITFDGSNNSSDAAQLNSYLALADNGSVAIIAKAVRDGREHGWVYATHSIMLEDRENRIITPDALRLSAETGSEVTFTVIAPFTQYRAGVDRDADGYFDGDEIAHGSNPADAASVPSGFCRPDFNSDGKLDSSDFEGFTAAYNSGSVTANYDHSLNASGLPDITAADLATYQNDYQQGCNTLVFQNGFDG